MLVVVRFYPCIKAYILFPVVVNTTTEKQRKVNRTEPQRVPYMYYFPCVPQSLILN